MIKQIRVSKKQETDRRGNGKRSEKREGRSLPGRLVPAVLAVVFCLSLTGCVNHMKEGKLLLEKGQYEKALEQFEKAAQDKPAQALHGQAMALFKLEDYEGAATAIQSAIDKGVYETPQLYNMLAVCHMKRENYAGALEAYNTALALVDARAGMETINEGLLQEMRFNQIVCLEKTADWEQAKEKTKKYVEDYPDDEEAKREATFLSTR